jgi:RNA polymerase sigma-70 factor, ECF subfamily
MSQAAYDEFATPAFVALLQKQDRVAVERVVHEYLPQIVRAARGAGLGQQDAEEITQQVFVTFIESLPRFEGRSHVRTWLFGILYHKLRETRRGYGKERRHDDIDDVLESRFDSNGMWERPPASADDAVWNEQLRVHLEECLEDVPERYRLAFVLREVEGLASKEICKILDVTATNMGVILYRARNRLRECLELRGIGESSP